MKRFMAKPPLTILLAAPRGFCAGVVRAIDIVERALAIYGAPVYVRHEIVHNKYVVDDLRAKGAIFVDELDEIPAGDHPVVFSAHGVPKAVPLAASARKLFHIDATCPLVSKVHMEAQRHFGEGLEIILIGHRGHPEVIGTMGQLPEGAIRLIETVAEAEAIAVRDPSRLAYATQTTLSVDDTRDMIAVLQRRFPSIRGPTQRRHLLCHDQPPGGGEGSRATHRSSAGRGRSQFVEFEAAGGSGAEERLPARITCSAGGRSRLDGAAGLDDGGTHGGSVGAGGAGQ